MARLRALCLAWARPTRFVTLTQAPDDWQALRQKVRTLTMRLRREGYRVEWAWTVERGSKTGMKHLHALQHGDYIPQRRLQDAWGRIVHIEAIRGTAGATEYALKEATRVTGYATKNAHADLSAHLELNGGRGYHMTRRYLHGRSTREVEQLVRPVDPDLSWITVPMTTTIDEGRALAHASRKPIESIG